MKTFTDYQQGVAERIQDAAGKLSSTAIDGCIHEAIAGRYSAARPLRKVMDIVGDGVHYQWSIDQSSLPGWQPTFSIIDDIEYPAGERVPTIFEKGEWLVTANPNGIQQLILTRVTP